MIKLMYLKQNEHLNAKESEVQAVAEPETSVEVVPEVLLDQPWRVIVWDDPVNLINYVVWVFQKTFGYAESKARALAEKIHFSGNASVWTGNKERAEMYVQRMHSYQLRATLEKDE